LYPQDALPELTRFQSKQTGFDLQLFRGRRFYSQFIWRLANMMLEEVRSDVAGAKNKIRFLTARTIRLRHLVDLVRPMVFLKGRSTVAFCETHENPDQSFVFYAH